MVGPLGWLHLEGAFICSMQYWQPALLEQIKVEGIKASCVVLVDSEASRAPGEQGEEDLLIRQSCGPEGRRGAQ